ncbi:hypothetical protein SUGI_0503000 [Cryptomeria japonica]|nr:hypothetical protein SUGI_0503000 [Cryptomeria japonica]
MTLLGLVFFQCPTVGPWSFFQPFASFPASPPSSLLAPPRRPFARGRALSLALPLALPCATFDSSLCVAFKSTPPPLLSPPRLQTLLIGKNVSPCPPRVSVGAKAGYAWHQRPKSAALSQPPLHVDESRRRHNVAVGFAKGAFIFANRKKRPYRRWEGRIKGRWHRPSEMGKKNRGLIDWSLVFGVPTIGTLVGVGKRRLLLGQQ